MKSTLLVFLVSSVIISSVLADQPVITSSPGDLTLEQSPGERGILSIEFENPDAGAPLPWDLVFEDEPLDPLERLLDELKNSPENLLSLLPDRFKFEGGEAGTRFDLGGGFGILGNRILLNDTWIRYSNFGATSIPAGEGTTRYATAKLPGLFVFSGELEGISDFSIQGSIDNSSGVEIGVDEFTLEVAGTTWRAFTKRVWDHSTRRARFRRPSNNQMVLVPDAPGLSSSYNPTDPSIGPAVTNLPASTPLHYFYFSRAEGASYDRSVFEGLAETFLRQILPGPDWAQPATATGTLPAGESARINLQIDSNRAAPGLQTTRFAVVTTGTDPETLPPSTWKTLSLTLTDDGIAIPAEPVRLSTIAGVVAPPAVEIEVRPAPGAPPVPPLTVTSSADWLTATALPNHRWEITATTSELAPGAYLEGLTFSNGMLTREVFVQIEVASRNPIELLADPIRPRLYALSRLGAQPGFLLVHDTATQTETAVIRVGRGPIDFALNDDANTLFVLNSEERSLSRVDLETLTVTETIPLVANESPPGNFESRLVAGPGSVVYYTDEAPVPTVHVFDVDSRELLQSLEAGELPDNDYERRYRYGNIALDEQGDHLLGWMGASQGGFGSNTYLARFAISAGGRLSDFETIRWQNPLTSNRGLNNYPILTAGLPRSFILRGSFFDTANFGSELAQLPRNAYSLSPGGELMGTTNGIYHLREDRLEETGGFPPNAFTPDYAWFADIGESSEILWTDLGEITPPFDLGLVFTPAESGGMLLPGTLRWPPAREARIYQIYVGTDAAQVAAADPSSTAFVGSFPGQSAPLPDDLEPGQSYFWKVIPDQGGTPQFEQVRSFTVLPIDLERESLESTTVAGAARRIEPFPIAADPGVNWELSTAESWISVENATGSGNGTPIIVFDSRELEEGNYFGEVVLTVNENTLPVPVTVTVVPVQVAEVQKLPDENTIWVSSVRQGDSSFLLAYDIAAQSFETVIPTDLAARHLAVHRPDNRVYLAQTDPAIIRGYDLSTLEEIFSHDLYEGLASSSHHGEITAISPGAAGRLIVQVLEDNEPSGPRQSSIRLIDTTSGVLLDEFDFGTIPSGSGVSAPDGSTYYHGGPKPNANGISRFDLSGDQFVKINSKSYLGTLGAPDVLMSADGTRILWNGGVFDTNLNLVGEVQELLYAISGDATMVAGRDSLYNSTNGLAAGSLPVRTSRKTFDGSGEVLYSFVGDVVVATRLSDFLLLPDQDVVPGLADGTTVTIGEAALFWEPEANATSYDVYFGADREQLMAADPSSSSFLGEVTSAEWDELLPGIALGGTYYWRVDMNGVNQSRTGSVIEFSVASLEATPAQVILPTLVNQAVETQKISFRSADGDAWSATASDPWIVLDSDSGAASENLTFTINTNSLSVGTHTGSIAVASGGETIEVRVEVDLVAPNIVRFLVDPDRSRIYGLNDNDPFDFDDWNHLFAINPETAEIEDLVRIGRNVTDLVIDSVTDRLIATNDGYPETRVVDLTRFKEVEPLILGDDVFSLEIDPERRILITETERDQVSIRLFDLDTSDFISRFSSRAGFATIDPAGNIYYRTQGSKVENFDLEAIPPVKIAEADFEDYLGPILSTADGRFVVAGDKVFNPNLEIVTVLPREALNLSPTSALAVSSTAIHWLDDKLFAKDLPFTADVATFTADGSRLVLFNARSKQLESIPLSSIIELTGSTPRDGQFLEESPPELAWQAVAEASSYTVRLSSPLLGSRIYEGITETRLPLPVDFSRGEFVTWSVTAGFSDRDPETSPDYRFGVGIPRRTSFEGTAPYAFQIGPEHILSRTQGNNLELRSFDEETGEITPVETISVGQPLEREDDPLRTVIDRFRCYQALPEQTTPDDATGRVLSFDVGAYNRVQTTSLPTPAGITRRLGEGFAVSGGLILSSGRLDDGSWEVVAYQAHPEMVQTQTIPQPEGRVSSFFGRKIALHGNISAISSAGSRSQSPSQDAAIFIYERDLDSGEWSQVQQLDLPGVTFVNAIQQLAMNGRFLAVRAIITSEVFLFQRDEDGLWTHQTTLVAEKEDDPFPFPFGNAMAVEQTGDHSEILVEGAKESFGEGMALSGNRLFIGDPKAKIDAEEGVVFTFVFDGERWSQGVPVLPPNPEIMRQEFGRSLATRDRWLIVGARPLPGTGPDTTGHLFEIDPNSNRTPIIISSPVTQAVSGRPFELLLQAEDPDGNEGLLMEALQLPEWLEFTDLGNGEARLTGIPTAQPGSFDDLQFRVTDPDGAASYDAFRLTLLAPTDVPVLTGEPEDLFLTDGQDLLLRARAEGEPPLTWQWFHNNEPIPGAIRPTLEIAEATLDDMGEYRAEVRNAVGMAGSETAMVTITEAGRDGGPWFTTGSSMRRSGFHPARLKRHRFVPAWSRGTTVFSPSEAAIANNTAILSGRSNTFDSQGLQVFAFNLTDGELVWSQRFEAGRGISDPSIHRDRVYLETRDGNANTLRVFSIEEGTPVWDQNYFTQASPREGPAVNDRGIWTGKVYDLDGTPRALEGAEQRSLGSPTLFGDRIFKGYLQERDPDTVELLWSYSSGASIPYSAAIRNERAFMVSSLGLSSLDLAEQEISWFNPSRNLGSFAVGSDRVFTVLGDRVLSFNANDGTPGPSFASPNGEAIERTRPLLLHDHLLVSTANDTLIFDLETTELVQVINLSGRLSYAEGRLIIAEPDGQIHAWFANGAPEFTTNMPVQVDSGDAAPPFSLELNQFVSDPDPEDTLSWAVVSNSNSDLFRTLEVDPDTGELSVIYNPWQSGDAEITFSVADPAGNVTETTLTFTLPPHPAPELELADSFVLNRRSGLYEHSITVTNSALREIAGFDLAISNLPDGTRVYGASPTVEGVATLAQRQVLAAGESVTLDFTYYLPIRGTELAPDFTATIVTEPEDTPVTDAPGLEITRCVVVDDGVLIEFTTVPGRMYEIHYFSDNATSKVSSTRLRAGGNRVQWIDRGPPQTDSPPLDKSARFYRVRELAENE